MIEELPQELLEEIFKYCFVKHLINVACCNKLYYSLVKPSLWRAVNIRFAQCGPSPYMLHNLMYAVKLNLYQDVILDADDDNDMDNSFDSGVNLARLVNSCNPLKVSHLGIENIAQEGIYYALEILCNIKHLKLSRSISNWKKVNQLQKLKGLVLRSCEINEDGIEEILTGDKLEELHLTGCSILSNKSLLHISKAKNLTKLFIIQAHSPHLEIRPLGNLINLIYLTIEHSSIKDESLVHLCRSLKQLKGLNLTKSIFTDQGLREVHALTNLTKLILYNCMKLTGKCFEYISSLESLHDVHFSDIICSRGEVSDKDLCLLNKVTTLKQIFVLSRPEKIAGILKSLCAEKAWKLRINVIRSADLYILTR